MTGYNARVYTLTPVAMQIPIVYEDEHLLVVNKPAGLVVNRAETVTQTTLQEWVIERLGRPEDAKDAGIWMKRGGLAHRLDKDTSGCLVVGKSERILAQLMRQFKQREVKKTYVAMVHGKLEPQEGYWRLPVKRSSFDRQSFTVDVSGKMALTDYRVADYLSAPEKIGGREGYPDGLTYVKLFPRTGRTHQLRVHLKHMKHPIVADQLYLSKKRLGYDLVWCTRHFLHALAIEFEHPVEKKRLRVESGLADDLAGALAVVGGHV